MGSLLVRSPDGTQVVRYKERLTAVTAGNLVSRSRMRSRVVSARRCSSFSLAKGVQVSPGRRRSVSYDLPPPQGGAPPAGGGDQGGKDPLAPAAPFTWSPLPPRRAHADVCVALFCDDTWANIEEFEALIDSLPGGDGAPTPTPSSASSTLRRRHKEGLEEMMESFDDEDDVEIDESFFEDDFHLGEDVGEGGSSGVGGGMRPSTNPRDTPTFHTPLMPSPSRKVAEIGKEDLTLESLHDLDWLQRMEPSEQMILEVHIIWSILTLMVVLLACYSIQHHSL